ncbi:MAG: hypothetical protein AB7O97_08900 [Planctomycetota bacterium]
MTSQRKRKRTAQREGLTTAELQLCELLREVLAALRWSQVLGWGNQYLLQQRLEVTPEERDRVMRAAAQTVEQDPALRQWEQRLQEIEQRLAAIDGALRGRDAAPSPRALGAPGDGIGGADAAPGAEAEDGA